MDLHKRRDHFKLQAAWTACLRREERRQPNKLQHLENPASELCTDVLSGLHADPLHIGLPGRRHPAAEPYYHDKHHQQALLDFEKAAHERVDGLSYSVSTTDNVLNTTGSTCL